MAEAMKAGLATNDLLERLRTDPAFESVDFGQVLDRGGFVGRAPEQVSEWIRDEVTPIRQPRVAPVRDLMSALQESLKKATSGAGAKKTAGSTAKATKKMATKRKKTAA